MTTAAITVLLISIATTINAFAIIGLQSKNARLEARLRQLERTVG
jgi:hypothetical protein